MRHFCDMLMRYLSENQTIKTPPHSPPHPTPNETLLGVVVKGKLAFSLDVGRYLKKVENARNKNVCQLTYFRGDQIY